MSVSDGRAMLDRGDKELSIRRQCVLVGVARSGVYRPRKPANDNDAPLLRRIDELFTAWPFLGSRRLTAMLRAEGCPVNRKRVQRLMRQVGIAALGPKPNTSKPAPGHKICPYLLQGLAIERVNQVWAADITYIPIGRGFLYLVAIIDWASRGALSWRLSNTMDVSFAWLRWKRRWRSTALQKSSTPIRARSSPRPPSRVCSLRLASPFPCGRGRWMDNAFIERLWRPLKHEDIYLKGYADSGEARAGIAAWIAFYNHRRLHQALGYLAPDRKTIADFRKDNGAAMRKLCAPWRPSELPCSFGWHRNGPEIAAVSVCWAERRCCAGSGGLDDFAGLGAVLSRNPS